MGNGSSATGSRSTAIGFGAQAHRDNEMALGTRESQYRLRGLSPKGGFINSRYQNSGEKRIVTTDSAGTLGTTDFSVDKLLDTVGATGAMSAAMGSLPTTVLLPDETFRCGIGTGAYASQFAGALGCAAKIQERFFLNAGIAASTSDTVLNGPMGRLGFSIGFGGSPSKNKQTELSTVPNTFSTLQSSQAITHFGNGSNKQVYSMRGNVMPNPAPEQYQGIQSTTEGTPTIDLEAEKESVLQDLKEAERQGNEAKADELKQYLKLLKEFANADQPNPSLMAAIVEAQAKRISSQDERINKQEQELEKAQNELILQQQQNEAQQKQIDILMQYMKENQSSVSQKN